MSLFSVRRAIIRIFWSLGLVLAVAGLAPAQYTTATLSGGVTDPSGGAVTDAKVTVQNLETGLQRDAQTGVSGAFTFTALPVGKYQLTVEKEGFSKYVQSGIILVLDQTATVPVQLSVGNLSQEVTVSADAELLNTQSGTVGQLIDQRRIVDLPLDGRQPQNLLFLSAGTVNETGNYCLVNCQGGVYPRRGGRYASGAGPARGQLSDGWRWPQRDTYLNTNLPFPNPDAVQSSTCRSTMFRPNTPELGPVRS